MNLVLKLTPFPPRPKNILGQAAVGSQQTNGRDKCCVIPAPAQLHTGAGCGGNPVVFKTMERIPCVYMLASGRNGTLYIGVTSDLVKRTWEHKNDLVPGFTKKYSVYQLVWYEIHENMESAILREKQLKKWNRSWKLRLIEEMNADWEDLYEKIL